MQEISRTAPGREKPALWPIAMGALVLAHQLLMMLWWYDTAVTEWLYQNGMNLLIPMVAGMVLLRRDIRRQPIVWLLWAYVAWMLLSQAIAAGGESVMNDISALNYVALAFLAFPLAQALPTEKRGPVLRAILHVFLLVWLAICAGGLVVAFTQGYIAAPSGYLIGMYTVDKRLYLASHPNAVGMLCMAAITLSMYSLLQARKVLLRILYVLAMLVFATTLVLTDSRASLIATALCVGAAFFLLVRARLSRRGAAAGVLAGLLAWAVVSGACIGLFRVEMNLIGPYVAPPDFSAEALIERIRNDTSGLEAAKEIGEKIENGDAEGSGAKAKGSPDIVTARGLVSDTFNGRTRIWKLSFDAIKRDPSILLIGSDSRYIPETLYPNMEKPRHEATHNTFIEILLQGGLPGLGLALVFLALLLVRSLRLFLDTSDETTVAMRYIPLLLLGYMAVGMMESILFGVRYPFNDMLFFTVAGAVAALAPSGRRACEGA